MKQGTQHHLKAMYRVMRYCMDTPSCSKILRPVGCWDGTKEGFEFVIRGRSDSDFAKDPDKRHSVSGISVFLQDAPISESSRMQDCVTLSVSKAEIVAAVETGQRMLFGMRVLEQMGLTVQKPMILQMDCKGAIALTHSWSVGGRTRHIDVKWHFLREMKEEGIIHTVWLHSPDNSADLFTKLVQISASMSLSIAPILCSPRTCLVQISASMSLSIAPILILLVMPTTILSLRPPTIKALTLNRIMDPKPPCLFTKVLFHFGLNAFFTQDHPSDSAPTEIQYTTVKRPLSNTHQNSSKQHYHQSEIKISKSNPNHINIYHLHIITNIRIRQGITFIVPYTLTPCTQDDLSKFMTSRTLKNLVSMDIRATQLGRVLESSIESLFMSWSRIKSVAQRDIGMQTAWEAVIAHLGLGPSRSHLA